MSIGFDKRDWIYLDRMEPELLLHQNDTAAIINSGGGGDDYAVYQPVKLKRPFSREVDDRKRALKVYEMLQDYASENYIEHHFLVSPQEFLEFFGLD